MVSNWGAVAISVGAFATLIAIFSEDSSPRCFSLIMSSFMSGGFTKTANVLSGNFFLILNRLRIKKKFPERTLAVFVKPPDINELIIRLKQRGEESSEKIAMRVAKAPTEMATAPQFDTIILNDDLTTALNDAENLVNDFLNK